MSATVGGIAIVVAATALDSLDLATHAAAHGAIVRPVSVQRWREVAFGTPLLISPTVWRRVPTQAHHAHTNSPRDPDGDSSLKTLRR